MRAVKINLTTPYPYGKVEGGNWMVCTAKGMAQVTHDAGLSRESLYKALSGERSPGFDTILRVVGALGLTLHAQVPQKHGSRRSAAGSRTRTPKRRAA